jgi:hypothetical protein
MTTTYPLTERHPEYGELLHRLAENPLLFPKDWPYPANAVFNPGAVRLQETGEILFLVRVEGRRGHSHLCAARFPDSVKDWIVDNRPTSSCVCLATASIRKLLEWLEAHDYSGTA